MDILLTSLASLFIIFIYVLLFILSKKNFKLFSEVNFKKKNLITLLVMSIIFSISLILFALTEITIIEVICAIYICFYAFGLIGYMFISLRKNSKYDESKIGLIEEYQEEIYSIVKEYIKDNNHNDKLEVEVKKEKNDERYYLSIKYNYNKKLFYKEELDIVNLDKEKKYIRIYPSFNNKNTLITCIKAIFEPFFDSNMVYVDKFEDINNYVKLDINQNMIDYSSSLIEKNDNKYYDYYFKKILELEPKLCKYLEENSVDYRKPLYISGDEFDNSIEYSVVYACYVKDNSKNCIIKINNGIVFMESENNNGSIVIRFTCEKMV